MPSWRVARGRGRSRRLASRTACTRTVRLAIETLNSQLTAMGVAHLHVRSVAGLEIKVHASLLALACLNVN